MTDPKQKRLDVLRRLRELRVEEARADHVAAQAELAERSAQVDDTQQRIVALDTWAGEQFAAGARLLPDVLRQAQLMRGFEERQLEQQRGAEAESRERTDAARGELVQRFEQLSVTERLAARRARDADHEQLRRAFIELDEAGARRANLDVKE